jgi:small subunit ribosomal protein S11
VQTEADKDLQSFQPASMSQMPIPNPSSPLPSLPPLPQRRPTQSQAGYFHVHAVSITKNIHVTITDYKHDPVVAMSAGRIGLKHSRRQTQEAAYSTAVAAFEKFSQTDLNVDQVELVLKGFGKGRAGFLSAIESAHGEFIKKKVVRITDATPMQIGAIKARNVKRR